MYLLKCFIIECHAVKIFWTQIYAIIFIFFLNQIDLFRHVKARSRKIAEFLYARDAGRKNIQYNDKSTPNIQH